MSTITITPSGWTYVSSVSKSANYSGVANPKSSHTINAATQSDANWTKYSNNPNNWYTYGTVIRFSRPNSLKYAKINSAILHFKQDGSGWGGSGSNQNFSRFSLAKYTTENTLDNINWMNFRTGGIIGDWYEDVGSLQSMPYTHNVDITSFFKEDSNSSDITFVIGAGIAETFQSQLSTTEVESWLVTSDIYITVNYEAGTQPAPTPLYPKDVTLIESARTLFSWQFNSETEAVQTAAQLEYKATSAENYTVVSLTQSGYSYTLNQQLAPGSYQWRVKVTNDAGTVSGYSEVAYFSIVGRPATPIINDVPNKTLTEISWNTSNQQACEVILADQSGKELYHETLASGETFYKPNFFLKGAYLFSVRVMNDSLMWSDWAQRAFTITSAGPTAATVSLSAVGNAIKVTYALTEQSEAVIMRSDTTGEKILKKLSVEDTGTEFIDNTVASDVVYTYWIRAYIDGYTDSAQPTLSVHFEGSILTAEDITLNLTQSDEKFLPHSEDIYRDYALLNFSGREYPMIERGEFTTLEFARKYHVTDAQKAILDALCKKDNIFYRDNKKNAFSAALTRVHYDGYMNDGYITTINLVRLNEEEVEVNV